MSPAETSPRSYGSASHKPTSPGRVRNFLICDVTMGLGQAALPSSLFSPAFAPDFALVLGDILARLPMKTYRQVSRRMRKSSHGEALRTYHSSRSSFSSFVIRLPPLT